MLVMRGGQGRDRTGDLPLFRRTLVPTELPGQSAGPVSRGKPAPCSATLTGLEPATSAVTGRGARPLDDGGRVVNPPPTAVRWERRKHTARPRGVPKRLLRPPAVPRSGTGVPS